MGMTQRELEAASFGANAFRMTDHNKSRREFQPTHFDVDSPISSGSSPTKVWSSEDVRIPEHVSKVAANFP
jgi:hypothetical protein